MPPAPLAEPLSTKQQQHKTNSNMNMIPHHTPTTIPACLQEVDGHHIIAIEHNGMLYAGLACIIAPRSHEPLGLQAFAEMDVADEIPAPVDLPTV